jgi:hypothetical protein
MGNLKPYQKGTSGNLKGRPKTQDIREAIIETLEAPDKDFANILKAIINSLVLSALNGNIRAAELLFNYAYGKPKENENSDRSEGITVTISGPEPPTGEYQLSH